jgi:3-methyladenine DNA glycosylase/8-oxoguanine DNA glycosylase
MPTFRKTVAYQPPYDWSVLSAFLRARQIDGVERIGLESYARTFSTGDVEGLLEVTHVPARHQVRVLVTAAEGSIVPGVISRVVHLLDLELDPAVVAAHFGRDPLMRRLVAERPGLRVPGTFDPFELTVRAILGQQVTVAGATVLCSRLVQTFGRRLREPNAGKGLTHLFPDAATLARAEVGCIGMPRSRAATIKDVAAAVAADPRFFDGTPETVRRRLLSIRGIGNWTAQYVSMRALRDADAFPSGDLGVQRALARRSVRPTTRETEVRSLRWRPWRAYAAMHLWSAAR